MNETVSVIVPVYNAARFLKKCITSIVMQTYADLQIILVDDGSTDRSLDICKRFAVKDKRILVLHQENKGVSAARNYALDNVKGRYVTFVDADDWLPRNGIQNLYDNLVCSQAEYAVGRMYRLFPTKSSPEKFQAMVIEAIPSSNDDAIRFFSDMGYYAHVAKKLLRTDIILNHKIRFPEAIKCGEDSCFMLDYLLHCHRIASTDKIVYYNTRLYDNTGGTKYYPKRHIWAREVIKRLNSVTRRYLSSEKADYVVTKEAIIQTNKICNRHLASGDNHNECIRRVKETYLTLSSFVNDQNVIELSGDSDFKKAITEFLSRKERMNQTRFANQTDSSYHKSFWVGKTPR